MADHREFSDRLHRRRRLHLLHALEAGDLVTQNSKRADDQDSRSDRVCSKCGEAIPTGKDKIGRTVFKGGICYRCWVRAGKPGRAKK